MVRKIVWVCKRYGTIIETDEGSVPNNVKEIIEIFDKGTDGKSHSEYLYYDWVPLYVKDSSD